DILFTLIGETTNINTKQMNKTKMTFIFLEEVVFANGFFCFWHVGILHNIQLGCSCTLIVEAIRAV
ncbi:hypothetical protein ACJX0J_013837, partial [Zea mays]